MLTIGNFSKLGQVSTKTLRYYDQIGLLKPRHVSLETGYPPGFVDKKTA